MPLRGYTSSDLATLGHLPLKGKALAQHKPPAYTAGGYDYFSFVLKTPMVAVLKSATVFSRQAVSVG